MKTRILLSILATTAGIAQVAACGGYNHEPPQADYTAHEWGTFTSVAGSDGTLIPWNPFIASDLPSFVYTRTAPLRGKEFEAYAAKFIFGVSKGGSRWLQRMETPVIYFHADEPVTLSATVDFPQGLVTEWFPQVAGFGPSAGAAPLIPNTPRSFVHWDNVKVMPKADQPRTKALAKDGSNPMSMRVELAEPDHESHYTRARGTSANRLEVRSPLMTEVERRDGQDEEFLFYRGAGNFGTPLKVTFDDRNRVTLENTGRVALASLHFAEFKNGLGRMQMIPSLAAGERRVLKLAEATEPGAVKQELEASLQRSLVAAGLFEDEAKAMLNTWRPDWLGDIGARVLYLLPKQWADETLPLKLNPRPKNLMRVMVGRAEVLSPDTERTLTELLEPFPGMDRSARVAALKAGLATRFQDAAIDRLRNVKQEEARIHLMLRCGGPVADDEALKAQTTLLESKLRKLREEVVTATPTPVETAATDYPWTPLWMAAASAPIREH